MQTELRDELKKKIEPVVDEFITKLLRNSDFLELKKTELIDKDNKITSREENITDLENKLKEQTRKTKEEHDKVLSGLLSERQKYEEKNKDLAEREDKLKFLEKETNKLLDQAKGQQEAAKQMQAQAKVWIDDAETLKKKYLAMIKDLDKDRKSLELEKVQLSKQIEVYQRDVLEYEKKTRKLTKWDDDLKFLSLELNEQKANIDKLIRQNKLEEKLKDV